MIGPHQGKELELMLSGKKHFALFHDAVVHDQEISEEIIPENAFAPYIDSGQIIRSEYISIHPKSPHPIKYVFYTLPRQEWRVNAFLWMHEECAHGRRPFDDSYEYFIGRLLDYTEEDIQDYILNVRHILR